MKTLTIITLMTFSLINPVFSQDYFATYEIPFLGTSQEIQIIVKSETKYKYYVNMLSFDSNNPKGGVIVDQRTHNNFTKTLAEAKAKYTEWEETAKANNVDDFIKKMTMSCPVRGYFLYYKDWHFDYSVSLSFVFKVDEGEPVLLVRTGELTSSSNQFIDHDGFLFAFKSAGEIQEFIDIFQPVKRAEFLAQPKEEDLFK